MKLLTNNSLSNHLQVFKNLFLDSEKVYIAVAFLKNSGVAAMYDELVSFMGSRKKELNMFVGLSMGVTDPEALKTMVKLFKEAKKGELILCAPHPGIFHPKIYVFIKGAVVHIIIGSANMSERAWNLSDEVSIHIETSTTSKQFEEIMKYFEGIKSKYYEGDIDGVIKDYSDQLSDYLKNNKGFKRFKYKKRRDVPSDIDFEFLMGYFQSYPVSINYVDPVRRKNKYLQAREILEEIYSSDFPDQDSFLELYGQLVGQAGYEKLWHSGSIHRWSYKTAESIDSLKKLIGFIRSNVESSREYVFDRALMLNKSIKGVGTNIVTEIMMTYNFDKFANLNENPIKVLRECGISMQDVNRFNGTDYARYINFLIEIREEIGLNDMLEVDSFFNYIYWDLMANE